ncbi:trypsin-like peptidase domain-containing protein [Nocardia sp. NPDC050793]|uniref:trypsin-like peptidase domain-containing protein n=1 Tax=Nocardia sp. NPDC050793 TaxID=3155159 RepID=UPI0033F302F8
MDISPEMLAAKDALADALEPAMAFLPGVLGVDVGFRQEGVELTDEVVIRVLVSDETDIPFQLAQLMAGVGFPVAVVRREFTPLAGPDNAPHNPVTGGVTIRAEHSGFLVQGGTLGGIANDTMFGGQVGVTCAHVIASLSEEGEIRQGDPIFQPGITRRIGALHRWQDATDIAVFTFDDGVARESKIAEIGGYSGMARAKVGDKMRKRGRTTLLTTGVVSATGLRPLGIKSPANSFEIYSDNVAQQPILVEHGDSGSLVVNENGQIVGIITQKGIEFSSIATIGVPPPGAISAFATQMASGDGFVGAADSVGISF